MPIWTENLDGLTAPTLPTGWTFTGTWATTAAVARSSANSLTFATAAAVGTAFRNTADGVGGDVALTAAIRLSSLAAANVEPGLLIRSSATAYAGSNAYYLTLNVGSGESAAGLVLFKRVAGANTQLGAAVNPTAGNAVAANAWYVVTLSAIGTAVTGRVRRDSDGLYLTASATWSATAQDAIAVTDSAVTGAGYAGLLAYSAATATGFYFDDLSLSPSVTPPTAFTLTGPAIGRPAVASSNFTATLDNPATASTTVTPSDGGAGGTFTPTTVTIAVGATAGTFTYTASAAGAKTISATSSPTLTAPASLTYTAYSLALAPGSQSVASSTAATLTATLTGGTGTLAATTTAGTLSTAAPTSGTAFTLTAPAGSGTATVTVTGSGGTTTTATVAYAPSAATALTLAGPSTAPVGSASTAYTVGGNGTFGASFTVTPASTVGGDVFTPATVTVSAGSPTATFTLTATATGARTVTISTAGLTAPAGIVTTAAVTRRQYVDAVFATPAGAVGYALYDETGVYQARTTAGVASLPFGRYAVDLVLPTTWHGTAILDDTATAASWAFDWRP